MIKLNSIKNTALALGIAIVLNIFIAVGIATFYPSPQYEDFCPSELVRPFTPAEVASPETKTIPDEAYIKCQNEFNDVREEYNRTIFAVYLIAGLVSLGIGWMVSGSAAVSVGLTMGGVLAFLIGTIRGWSGIQDILRFVIVGVVLAILIWLGIRRGLSQKSNNYDL